MLAGRRPPDPADGTPAAIESDADVVDAELVEETND